MKTITILAAGLLLLLWPVGGTIYGAEKETLTAEQMIAELNETIALSKEQWETLKPLLEKKSDEVKNSINESVDKGIVGLDEMSRRLEQMSADSEEKVRAFMRSEEVQKLKEYFGKIDKEAVDEVKNKLIDDLSKALELTEEQLDKLKPVMDDSMVKLSAMIESLVKEGKKGWEHFKNQYEALSLELKRNMEETLDNQQMERFEKYKKEQQDKIERNLFV